MSIPIAPEDMNGDNRPWPVEYADEPTAKNMVTVDFMQTILAIQDSEDFSEEVRGKAYSFLNSLMMYNVFDESPEEILSEIDKKQLDLFSGE